MKKIKSTIEIINSLFVSFLSKIIKVSVFNERNKNIIWTVWKVFCKTWKETIFLLIIVLFDFKQNGKLIIKSL